MDPASHDPQLRQAAFDHVNRLATLRGGVLDSADLAGGFEFGGDRIPLINPWRGIFKPRRARRKTLHLRLAAACTAPRTFSQSPWAHCRRKCCRQA